MVQLNLNLMFACSAPASKNMHSMCAQPGKSIFVDLNTNGNPLHGIYEYTIHEGTSLGKPYTLTSMSNMQITRVHAGKKGDTQNRSPLSTVTLWYLCGINHHSIGPFIFSLCLLLSVSLYSQFAISKMVTPPWVQLLR